MWEDVIRSQFPGAEKGRDLTQRILGELKDKHNVDLQQCLFASSVCSDELNVLSTNFSDSILGPFRMGGLAGFPFGGTTAMTAFAHHVPEKGTALLYYGPHISVSKRGEIGKINRIGQTKETTCCGALCAALAYLQRSSEPPALTEDNYQYERLIQLLSQHKDQLLLADSPLKEITNITYNTIHSQMAHLLDATRSEFFCERVVLLGGVIINTDLREDDWVDVRNFDVLDLT